MQAELGSPRVTWQAMHRIEDRSQKRIIAYAAILGFFCRRRNSMKPKASPIPNPIVLRSEHDLFRKTGAHFSGSML
jgi:hypothetical protein